MQTQRQVVASLHTKPKDSGREFYPHPSSPFINYYSARKLILIYRSTEGGRLNRPRHCSKGEQLRSLGDYGSAAIFIIQLALSVGVQQWLMMMMMMMIWLQRAASWIAAPEGETGGEDNGTVQIFSQEKVLFRHVVIKAVPKTEWL